MREDDMLRLSLECARLAVHGENYGQVLAAGAVKIMDVDAGAGLTTWRLGDRESDEPVSSISVVVSGVPPLGAGHVENARAVVSRHPSFDGPGWFFAPANRLSDRTCLPASWETDVWSRMHGHFNGRFPAAVNFGFHGGAAVFLGVHRARRDFTDDDMEVLDLLRGPLTAALAFRLAWDQATNRLQRITRTRRGEDRLTTREAQVLALVSRGWTIHRVGHALGISERTVRRHMENINGKLGVSSRTAAATWWCRQPDRSC